jgi:hypothetical protein
MTKVLSLILTLVFVGFFTGAAEAGRCDHERYQWGTVVKPFCRENPRVGITIGIGIPHGHPGHQCRHRGCGRGGPMYRPQYRPMPITQGPQCRPCIQGFARVPMPGKPCWCEPIQ